MTTKKQSALKSPWVLGWLGLLVVFVGANIVMIYLASTGGPGLVVDDYYDRGQDYEENMLKRRARDPGWVMEIDPPERIDVGKPARFGFRIADTSGQPVTPESVTFYAYRPSDKDQDFSVPMTASEAGHYQAEIAFPLLGVWDILVSATREDEEYNLPYRLSAGVH